MAKPKYVIDTNAALALIDGANIPPDLKNALDGAELFASVITRMELYAKPAITPIELQSIGRFLAALTVVPLDEPVEKAAIAIRQARKIKLPDAIIAATAVILNAVCLSNDTHLVTLDWPGFNVQTTRFCE